MPNYKNGLIYKIDVGGEIYIGSTCDLNQRKLNHKDRAFNKNSDKYNCKLYKKIRDCNKWEMSLLELYPCNDRVELCKKEQEYIDKLKPTLNTQLLVYSGLSRKEYEKLHNKTETRLKSREKYYNKVSHYVTCECGAKIQFCSLERHRKSNKHLNHLDDLTGLK